MKDVLSGVLHTTELVAIAMVGAALGGIPLMIATIPLMAIPATKLRDDIKGNDIKHSIFAVDRKGHIHEDTLGRPTRFFSLLASKDKQKKFTEEALNMFVEMKEKDKNGEKKKYNTRSQALTLSLLKRLQKNGHIENLQYEKDGESSLIVEKILLGNFKDLFKRKKYPMYQITFNLTDKERKKEDLMELAFGKKKSETNTSGTSNTINNNKTNKGVGITNTVSLTQENTNTKSTPVVETRSEELARQKDELLNMKAELLAAKSVQPTNENGTDKTTQK